MLNPRPSSPIRAGRVVALLVVAALAAAACVPQAGSGASPTPTLAPTPTPSANPYDGVAEGAGAGIKLGYLSYGELVPFVVRDLRRDPGPGGPRAGGARGVRREAGPEAGRRLHEAAHRGRRRRGSSSSRGRSPTPSAVCAEVPAGVPVLAVEFAQDPCAKTLVGADDLRAGQIAGRAPSGSGSRSTGAARTTPTSRSSPRPRPTKSQRRMEGYRQGFSAVCPITNEQVGRADRHASRWRRRAMTDVLATLPGKTKIIVVAINGDAALGALDAAKAAGREGDVWVSGQGGEEPSRDLIRTERALPRRRGLLPGDVRGHDRAGHPGPDRRQGRPAAAAHRAGLARRLDDRRALPGVARRGAPPGGPSRASPGARFGAQPRWPRRSRRRTRAAPRRRPRSAASRRPSTSRRSRRTSRPAGRRAASPRGPAPARGAARATSAARAPAPRRPAPARDRRAPAGGGPRPRRARGRPPRRRRRTARRPAGPAGAARRAGRPPRSRRGRGRPGRAARRRRTRRRRRRGRARRTRRRARAWSCGTLRWRGGSGRSGIGAVRPPRW